MLSNKTVVIIPSINPKTSVCDVVDQTAQTVGINHLVIIIQVRDSKSIKEILSGTKYQMFQLEGNAVYFTPIDVFPLKRIEKIKTLNLILNIFALQLYLLFKGKRNVLLWNFFPHVVFINNFFFMQSKIIFDIVDYFTSPDELTQTRLNEKKAKLLKKAHHVFAISDVLKERYQKIFTREITVVPQGFDLDSFSKNEQLLHLNSSSVNKNPLRSLKNKKVLGFIGGINDRLDFTLLIKVIKAHPQHTFVFCGPITEDENISGHVFPKRVNKLMSLPNVIHISRLKREELLSIIKHFDICLIPYDTSLPFNLYSYPMKVFEYFYAGKPVLSTNIIELGNSRFEELIYCGNTVKSWRNYIELLLRKKWPKSKSITQKEMALANTWKNKIACILGYIESSKKF